MSPLKRKKLGKIRIELDKLDNSLIKIIKKRTNLVKKVLELKDKKNQIIDQKRINIILRNIKKKSVKNKIDPKITNRIWKNMIWAYIEYEKKNFSEAYKMFQVLKGLLNEGTQEYNEIRNKILEMEK